MSEVGYEETGPAGEGCHRLRGGRVTGGTARSFCVVRTMGGVPQT